MWTVKHDPDTDVLTEAQYYQIIAQRGGVVPILRATSKNQDQFGFWKTYYWSVFVKWRAEWLKAQQENK